MNEIEKLIESYFKEHKLFSETYKVACKEIIERYLKEQEDKNNVLQPIVSERKKLTDNQPDSNWIKVSEKLPARKPHRLDFVLIVKDNRVVMEALFNTKLNKFTNLNGSELKHEVTHWQPLPEPPKE